tara:strand:- start:227 stop:673 length:447 start_codon:yes stop_codon:yes gene_type:complete
MKKSIINSEGYGISNGTTTVIALLAGFVATNVSKIAVLSALLSLLITDPLIDAYSIYISMKDTNQVEAFNKFKEIYLSQLIIQGIFLIIVFISPTIYMSFIILCVLSFCLIMYDFNKRLKEPKIIFIEFLKIIGLIVFTFVVNKKALL